MRLQLSIKQYNRDLSEIGADSRLKMNIANDTRVKEIVGKSFEIEGNPGILDLGYNEDGYFHLKLDE